MEKKLCRRLCLLLAVALLLTVLGACGETPKGQTEKNLRVTASIFPVWDWLRVLTAGVEGVELSLLEDGAADPHSYQPTADDMVEIAECDLVVYVGGSADEWVGEALSGSGGQVPRAVCLLDALGGAAKTEEWTEGMSDEAEEEPEYDEHIWLSLRNAAALCDGLAQELALLDPAHAETYAANARAYREELSVLDDRFAETAAAAPYRVLLFGDRFPFRYLTDDYGLDYYAAFSGCSAETEVSFETIVFLAEKADELGLPAILRIETGDGAIAETVRASSAKKNQLILTLNSLQSAGEGENSYLAAMEENLTVLAQALGAKPAA